MRAFLLFGFLIAAWVPLALAMAPDADGDGVPDANDVCVDVFDPVQNDGDQDRVGDACDPDAWYRVAYYALHPDVGGLDGWIEDGTGRLPVDFVGGPMTDWYGLRLKPVCCGPATLTRHVDAPALDKVSVDWSFSANPPHGGDATLRVRFDDGSSVALTWTSGENDDQVAIAPGPDGATYAFASVVPDYYHMYRLHLILDLASGVYRGGILDEPIHQDAWSSTPSFPLSPTATRIVALEVEASGNSGWLVLWSVWDLRVHSDQDEDGLSDALDICPTISRPWHDDVDGDRIGDDCDPDNDNDGVDDAMDNCPRLADPDQTDLDTDGVGDVCDPDDDGDAVFDGVDNCARSPNPLQEDADLDASGDACDEDDDNDGVPDALDNCSIVANPSQSNFDDDAWGDPCDPDDDNDGIADVADNCAFLANPGQEDFDGDRAGDLCDPDDDNDGVADAADNCALANNPLQENSDTDADGDVCDVDDDNDGVFDDADNCVLTSNPGQEDHDADEVGDVCDPDDDNDGLLDDHETDLGTDPLDADSDDDSLSDGAEVYVHGSQPLDPDTDGDLVGDGTEVSGGASPTNPSSLPVAPIGPRGIHELEGEELPTDAIEPVFR